MQFVVIRLGKDDIPAIERLDKDSASNNIPFSFNFTCKQVEEGIKPGNYAILWLGSDNNKGKSTNWKKGARAIGKITTLHRHGGFNDSNDLTITVLSVFPASIDKLDFLEKYPLYYKHFSKYPIVGIQESRNNAIQKVKATDKQDTSALLSVAAINFPEVKNQLTSNAPELLNFLEFTPKKKNLVYKHTPSTLEDNDKVLSWLHSEIEKRNERNFLFLGAPGTGKTWYAQEIAKALTKNESDRFLFVQFHPSFSYDDFIEGYTPNLPKAGDPVGYRLEEKHFLNICRRAQSDMSNFYVIVIDELTRGDPSRVFGELLTYLELEYRDRQFALTYSGTKFSVPRNLIVIATANPYDRSVGELDDAMIRRFVMREFCPDLDRLELHLKKIGASNDFAKRLLYVFKLINEQMEWRFGHSHFWNLKDESDFRALWSSRILFLLGREFQSDESALLDLREKVESTFPGDNKKMDPSEVIPEET